MQNLPISLSGLILGAACLAPASAIACSSCGCTLSSDWENMDFSTQAGWKLDLRYDYLNQNQLRSGSDTISPAQASQIVNDGEPQEVEKYTRNNYVTLGIDYSASPEWGVNLQLPYIDRAHTTLGQNSDGKTPADEAYHSDTADLGDIKLIGRYQGFNEQHNVGVMFGVKLPTGSHTRTGTSIDPSAPGETSEIDRGLQPGSGSTDVILGAYFFDTLNQNWDYFAQFTYQFATDSVDQFRPGDGINLNTGLRFTGFTAIQPQLQLNYRHVERDRGDNADEVSTGGELVYLSPGFVLPVTAQASVYSFVQLPVYQYVNGVQVVPYYIASVGVRYAF